jgi:hypothetical protein
MRRQVIIIGFLSLLLIAFTTAAFAYYKNTTIIADAELCCEKQSCPKTGENLWEALTKQLIGAVSLGN